MKRPIYIFSFFIILILESKPNRSNITQLCVLKFFPDLLACLAIDSYLCTKDTFDYFNYTNFRVNRISYLEKVVFPLYRMSFICWLVATFNLKTNLL